ncbi:glycosyltransferase [Candidatus Micrarchaeota archaeon]|nr:glycosyltransferase [Candidatus Micrarchaeota archaeon]
MRIAFFSDVFDQLTGVSTHVQNFAELLAERGHDVTLYTQKTPYKPQGYKIVGLRGMPFFLNKEYKFVLPKFFPQYRIPFDADVVHAHTPYSVGLLGLWMARRHGKPLVTTTHTAAKNMTKRRRLERLAWRYLRWFYNKSDRVICQTRATEEVFRQHGVRSPVTIVSAGIDYDFYSKGNAGLFRKKYGFGEFVLSSCRLSHEKRPEWIMKACAELNLPVVLTSDGPLRERLERDYPNARFLGKLSLEDLRNCYASARLLALTSAEESEGIAIHEARAAGTPVIASALPCVREFVHDGIDGFTFPVGDYGEFKAKLGKLWSDARLRKKFVPLGRKEAASRDLKACVKKLEGVYGELCSGRS